MSERRDWIDIRVNEAMQGNPLVTEAAKNRARDVIKGLGSERQLRPAELAEIAKQLIVDLTAEREEAEDED